MINSLSKKNIGLIPNDNNIFHIIGIGGIGMSAIAKVLHSHGVKIQGSDISFNHNIEQLEALGIKCFVGNHTKDNIHNTNIIAYSSAIKQENPELIQAKLDNKIILSRHEMLHYIIYNSYNICVSGMHGKTTTSSMIALIFEYAKIKQLAMIGGIMQYNQSNCIIHKNFEWAVIEADESDDTFIKIPNTISIITNISPEHLDHHLTFDNIKNKFQEFINNIPYFGFSVVCVDDKEILDITKKATHNRIITYSINNEEATCYTKNIKIEHNNLISFDVYYKNKLLDNFKINIFGQFNIANCLAAIAVCHKLEIELSIIKNALFDFRSTKRRFEILGKFKNAIVIDDYAHHPREINVVIETARELANSYNSKLIGIFQPHRYTRLQKLQDSFLESKLKELDVLIVMPVYTAGEKEIMGINSENFIKQIKHNHTFLCKDFFEITNILNDANENDIILFMGAGDITDMAHELVKFKKNK